MRQLEATGVSEMKGCMAGQLILSTAELLSYDISKTEERLERTFVRAMRRLGEKGGNKFRPWRSRGCRSTMFNVLS